MLRAIDLSFDSGSTRLLDGLDLTIGGNDRIGLVGPNGCGKTTLVRLLAGELTPSAGRVVRAPGTTVGWQRQVAPSGTVGEALDAAASGLLEAERRSTEAAAHLGRVAEDPERLDAAMAELDAASAAFGAAGGWEGMARADAILDRLGVGTARGVHRDRDVTSLSGGEQSRVQLACLLLQEPTVLLLDEPTNHLDLDGRAWLQQHLAEFDGAVLVVSHDRDFLDATVTRVVELADGRLDDYPGCGWTAYRAERERRRQRQQEEFEAQEKHRRTLEASIAATKLRSREVEAENARNPHARRIARMVVRKAVNHEERLQRQIDGGEWKEAPREDPVVRLSRPGLPRGGGLSPRAWQLRGLVVRAGERVLADGLDLDLTSTDRVHVTGGNGAGKSSLVKAVVAEVEGAVTLPQTPAHLDPDRSAIDTLRAALPLTMDDAEDLLTAYLFTHHDWQRPIRSLSSGQVQRLLIATALHEPSRMLVLDEPTNHLDVATALLLEGAVSRYPGGLLLVSHDAAFVRGAGVTRRWAVGGVDGIGGADFVADVAV